MFLDSVYNCIPENKLLGPSVVKQNTPYSHTLNPANDQRRKSEGEEPTA